MTNNIRIVLCLPLIAASTASAFPLVPVNSFTGQYIESWESFPSLADSETYLNSPTSIMTGFGSISSLSVNTLITFDPQHGLTLGISGSVQIHGQRAIRNEGLNRTTSITFATPIKRFGGYWAARTSVSTGIPAIFSFNFYDENNALIDSLTFPYLRPGDGLLEWHGWASSTPIKRLTFTEDYVVIDDLQATIPEPATLLLLTPILIGLARKTRKR